MSTPIYNTNPPEQVSIDDRDAKKPRHEVHQHSSAATAPPPTSSSGTSRWAKSGALPMSAGAGGIGLGAGSATPMMGMGLGMGGMGLGLAAGNSLGAGLANPTPTISSDTWASGRVVGAGAATPMMMSGGGSFGMGVGGGLTAGTPLVGGLGMGLGMGSGGMLGLGVGGTPMLGGMLGGGGLSGATPSVGSMGGAGVGLGMATPSGAMFGLGMQTPMGLGLGGGLFAGATPNVLSSGGLGLNLGASTAGGSAATQAAPTAVTVAAKAQQLEKEYDLRNRYLTDEDLDDLMPPLGLAGVEGGGSGYTIVPVPPSYIAMDPERPNFYELAARALEGSGISGVSSSGLGDGIDAAAVYEVPEEMGNGLPNLTPDDVTSGAFNILLKYHKTKDSEIPVADIPYYIVMQQILSVKNGDARQRRIGTRGLAERAEVVGLDVIFECLIDTVYLRCDMNSLEKHAMVKLVERLVVRHRERIAPFTRKIVTAFQALLTDADPILRDDGRDVIAVLSSTVGIRQMYEAIKKDIDAEDDRIRRHTAKVIAVVAVALGPEEVMRIIRPVSKSSKATARHTIAKAVDEITERLGFGVARVAADLGQVFADTLLRDPDHRVKTDGALAFARFCDTLANTASVMRNTALLKNSKSDSAGSSSVVSSSASALEGATASSTTSSSSTHDIMASETYKVILQIVREQCRLVTGRRRTLAAFLRALGSMIPLMAPADAKRQSEEILPYLINHFNNPDDDLRRIVLRVVRQCLAPVGISAEYLRQYLLKPFFEHFWTLKISTEDRQMKVMLVATTTEIARKTGGTEVLEYLLPLMVADPHYEVHLLQERYPPLQELALDAVREVLNACGASNVPKSVAQRLVERGSDALRRDTEGTCRAVLRGFAAIVNACKDLIVEFRAIIVQEISLRISTQGNEGEGVRAQAADLLGMIAETLYNKGEGLQECRRVTNTLTNRIENEDRAGPLAASLRALVSFGKVIGFECLDPAPADLIGLLQPIIKNRDGVVQQFVVEMIDGLAMMYHRFARLPPQRRPSAAMLTPKLHEQLLDIATKDLFPLLACHRKSTRRVCIRAFSTLALVTTGFLKVATKLIENLTQDSRDIRILTATALAALADKCKPFTVIPFLVNEYQKCEGTEMAQTIQHSVLKAIRFILEEVGSDLGKDYIFALVPLIDRAATEQSLQMRRMALELIRAVLFVMVDAPVGGRAKAQFHQLAIHLLNLTHPNIVELLSGKKEKISEERLKLISATVQVYEVARLIVGSSVIFQYLANGLFHPSEKVRDIYWRTYNLVYLANPEALIPAYPPLDLVMVTTSQVPKYNEGEASTGDQQTEEIVEFGRLAYQRHELYTI